MHKWKVNSHLQAILPDTIMTSKHTPGQFQSTAQPETSHNQKELSQSHHITVITSGEAAWEAASGAVTQGGESHSYATGPSCICGGCIHILDQSSNSKR